LGWNFVRSLEFRELLAKWIQFLHSLATEKIKEQAIKQGGDTNIGQAIAEGLQEPISSVSKEELQKRTEENLRELLHQLGSKPQYQDLVRDLLKFWDTLRDYMESLRKKELEGLKIDHLQRSLKDAKDFIAEFTSKADLEKFINMFWENYNFVMEDEEIRNWFSSMRSYLELTFKQPETVTEEQRKKETEDIVKRGFEIFQREKWKDQFSKLTEQFQILLHNVKSDSTTQEFIAKLEKFGRDLIFNEQGLPDLFQLEDSLYQLKNILIPLFKKTLANIPIKRIDIITESYDILVEDIVVDATSFLPEHLDFQLLNVTHLDLKDDRKDVVRYQMLLNVDRIKPEFKRVKFYYRRKAFPKIEDYGLADIALTGEGAQIEVIWTIERKGKIPISELSKVKFEIDKLHIRIIGEATKHDILDTIMAPLFSNIIKKKLSSILEGYLEVKLEEINKTINEWFASRPLHKLEEKADQVLKETFKNFQENQQQPSIQAK